MHPWTFRSASNEEAEEFCSQIMRIMASVVGRPAKTSHPRARVPR